MIINLCRLPEKKLGKITKFSVLSLQKISDAYTKASNDYIGKGSALLWINKNLVAYLKYDKIERKVKEFDISDYLEDHINNEDPEFSVKLIVNDEVITDYQNLTRKEANLLYDNSLAITSQILSDTGDFRIQLYHTNTKIIINEIGML